jgi:ribosomal protein L37AE/L43A
MTSSAGKGDVYRLVDRKKWDINYDAIYNPPKCLKCRRRMVQWMVGQDMFYCKNLKCSEFSKRKGRDEV